MPYIEGWDPGKATGFAMGYYDDHTAFELFGAAIHQTIERVFNEMDDWSYHQGMVRVVEGFRLRGSNNFTANLAGVEVIGAMKYVSYYRDVPLVWQVPQDKALVRDQVLKDHGLWQTGEPLGHTDGRDANDAIIHILAYLKKQEHRPTLRKYWGKS